MANTAEKNSADTQRDLAAAMSTLASRPAPTGKRPLTGRERAAVLMLALGEQYGAKTWGMLDDDELRELSVAMSAIGAIEADVVENLLLEFVTRMSASGALMGSYEATERLLQHTFDDLVKLDPGSAQTLMRHIEKDKLAVALKDASEPIRQFFMSNMSTRAAKMLADDMGAMGPVRLRDVDEAQVLLVNLAKDLAAKGEIVISKTRGEEELIY